ncbi:DUF1428 domain-containing protein [Chitinibacter sp. FCG-7]|uniref:DUF1428 domain-containing protein n=1 Tax=Chitinibacter mangrovi TaxID=3153927 RepID=A0AAU7F9M4_9NEIS
MTHYVDGFLLPIALEKLADYQKMANTAGAVWKEHGAIAYWECVGDELEIPDMLSFRAVAGCRDNETVVMAWIIYPSREERDRINALVMADPRLSGMCDQENPPFDFKRMAYGGFKSIVRYE